MIAGMSLVTHAQCHECDEVGQDYLTAVGRCSVWISMSLRVANTTLTAISYAKNDVKVPREATLHQFTSSLGASSSAIAPCANWVGGTRVYRASGPLIENGGRSRRLRETKTVNISYGVRDPDRPSLDQATRGWQVLGQHSGRGTLQWPFPERQR